MKRLATLAVAILLTGLAGCSTLSGPVDAAETVEQKAAAVYGTYVIALELAADVAENESTPDSVVVALADAGDAAQPVAVALLEALLEVNAIKAEFEAGETSEERLDLAIDNLNGWIDRAAPVIDALLKAVADAKD